MLARADHSMQRELSFVLRCQEVPLLSCPGLSLEKVTEILWTGKCLFSGIPGEQESSETETKSAAKERHLRAGIEPGATYMRRLSLGQTKNR